MRKVKTVKIQLDNGETKEFTVKELTCQNIIDLTQNNSLFTDSSKNSENGEELKGGEFSLLNELNDFGKEINKVIKMSCEFTTEDLKPLAPSELKEIYNALKEVNSDFLHILEKVGISQMLNQLLARAGKTFSGMLAPLSNQVIPER